MSGPSLVALIALLAGALLLILGAMVFQEAKRRSATTEVVYVISDAVRFIEKRLDPARRERLGKGGVKRIIEWELHYLQGLAQPDRRNPVETVAGGSEAAVAYVTTQIAEVNHVTYDPEDVEAVLRLEAEYLLAIGAVGEPVEEPEALTKEKTEEA